jgi:hypothetical protein
VSFGRPRDGHAAPESGVPGSVGLRRRDVSTALLNISLFTKPSVLDYIGWRGWLVNDELQRIWKEAVVA